jgi:transglutaminase-like putative cysteine protease
MAFCILSKKSFLFKKVNKQKQNNLIMKKLGLLFLLISLPLVIAQSNLYQKDSLQLQFDLSGKINLVQEDPQAQLQKVDVDLLLYPKDDYRQQVQEVNKRYGEVKNNIISYEWKDPTFGEKAFGYSALINTKNERVKVMFKVPYPLKGVEEMQDFLVPTEMIDSNNLGIINKATELTEGEDDTFKIAFKLASWVEENIHYDLSTLGTKSAQKASTVLENKQGVCEGMTSLFVAMCRSVGIPARFVSGVSYTNSPLFNEPWQPHGWAEVYFPEIGWVSFDTAFGEYGYVDVTHIKLRDGTDPGEPASKYEWLGNNVKLTSDPLTFKLSIIKEGREAEEPLQLEQELASENVDFGSYNLVKGVVKNDADYYAATTLQLAVPPEVEVLGRNKRTILLAPKEVKETYWTVKVKESLNPRYWYVFPTLIYSEKNVTIKSEFKVQTGNPFYSKSDIDKLIFVPEEKSYSRKVSLACNLPKQLLLNESKEVTCTIKNIGNTNLEKVDFCVGGVCEKFDLPINQQANNSVKLLSQKIGWNKFLVSAVNDLVDKKISIDYRVLDTPTLEVLTASSPTVSFGQSFQLNLTINKISFSPPQKVKVILVGAGMEQHFDIEELKEAQFLEVEMRGDRLSSNNKYLISATWQDEQNQTYSLSQEFQIRAEASNFEDKVRMFLNGILSVFG